MIPLIRALAAVTSDGLSAADGRRLLVQLQGPQAAALAPLGPLAPLAPSGESGSRYSTGCAGQAIRAGKFTEA